MTAAISKPQWAGLRSTPPLWLHPTSLHCLRPVSPHLRGLFITRRDTSPAPAPTPSVRASASWRVQQIHFAWRQRARPMRVVTLDNPPPQRTHTHKHTLPCAAAAMTPGDRRLKAARFPLEAARDGRPRVWWREEEEEVIVLRSG